MRDEYLQKLRRRWSHRTLRDAALMTFLSEAKDDEDADRKLRESGRHSMTRMFEAGVLQPDLTVYEIGCGCGRVATELANYLTQGQYVGVDLSSQYIMLCKKRSVKGQFEVTNGYSFPLPDESADLVIEFSIFCHMPLQQVWLWLCDTRRVLKSSGKSYLQFHNLASDNQWNEFSKSARNWKFIDDPGHPRSITWDTVELLHRRAGLSCQCVQQFDIDPGGPRSWFAVGTKV